MTDIYILRTLYFDVEIHVAAGVIVRADKIQWLEGKTVEYVKLFYRRNQAFISLDLQRTVEDA